jgi:hypothetical protein
MLLQGQDPMRQYKPITWALRMALANSIPIPLVIARTTITWVAVNKTPPSTAALQEILVGALDLAAVMRAALASRSMV